LDTEHEWGSGKCVQDFGLESCHPNTYGSEWAEPSVLGRVTLRSRARLPTKAWMCVLSTTRSISIPVGHNAPEFLGTVGK